MKITNPSKLIGTVSGLAISSLALSYSVSAIADPTGIVYDVLLDAEVITTDPDGNPILDIEGHFGSVPFDGLPDSVPNDLIPPVPPFVPGNNLIVTEFVTPLPNNMELIDIIVEGQDPTQPFPTPGAPLFTNPIDPAGFVAFEVLGFYWDDMPNRKAKVNFFDLSLSFSVGPDVPIEPLLADIVGSGTIDDPLDLLFELDLTDFDIPPTDLKLTFKITHVPEPSTVLMLGTTVLMMAGSTLKKRQK